MTATPSAPRGAVEWGAAAREAARLVLAAGFVLLLVLLPLGLAAAASLDVVASRVQSLEDPAQTDEGGRAPGDEDVVLERVSGATASR